MALFNIFKKKENSSKGFNNLSVNNIQKLTDKSIKITFEIPSDKFQDYHFLPGQYIDLESEIDGEKIRRSYSICSLSEGQISIGVKFIENGKMSGFLKKVNPGDNLSVSTPKGNFTCAGNESHIVCFAAGSGITPIISILNFSKAKKQLFFSNKSLENTMFRNELFEMNDVVKNYYFTQVNEENHKFGRLNKEAIIEEIKADLNILKADTFFLCGPYEMVKEIKEALNMFGVSESKIKHELFESVIKETPKNISVFSGNSQISVTLDGEVVEFEIKDAKKTILEGIESKGMDAPYSCRGGVCCSCKAKVLDGSVNMKVNYSLTDEEVTAGYILTCQAVPSSDHVKISFDE